jgi:two-component system response regulator FlrC
MNMKFSSILLVEDNDDLRDAIAKTLNMQGYSCIAARNGKHALQCLEEHAVQLVLTDVQMPQLDGLELLTRIRQRSEHLPVLMMTAYGTIEKAVEALQLGANDYLTKPFESQRLLKKIQQLLAPVACTHLSAAKKSECIIVDKNSKELYRLAERVAPTDSSVLIYGESGTGKEVLARYIHDHSSRADQPFVALNCAAIPDNMLEAILFGFEKGAFTGAHQSSAGKFEQANGGTLLLDEISEMPLALQAKLLRVLQEREVERIGGKKPIKLSLRVLATTNRELKFEISAGRFREDLFYRLNVFPLYAKPLRQRIEDILPLANFFMQRYQSEGGNKTLSQAACQALKNYDWPGNIRQLENIIQRSLILSEGLAIQVADLYLQECEVHLDKEARDHNILSPSLQSSLLDNEIDHQKDGILGKNLRHREYELIIETLKSQRGSREETARALGISSRTLRYKMAKMRSEGVLIHEY